jgi:hypothetical protein
MNQIKDEEENRDRQIKEAFQRVRRDIGFLNNDLSILRIEITKTNRDLVKIYEIQKKILENTKIQHTTTPVIRQITSTSPTHNPAHDLALKPLNPQNLTLSTGNEGVPADRQTNQQTDRQEQNSFKTPIFLPTEPRKNSIEDAAKILDSLDSLKKEIRLKFKQLTDQEVLVFSTLYQLDEQGEPVDYKILAIKLGLTESSIRDYIARLLKKDIPVEKKRINNKQIQLTISPNLKKIASLSTILQLRGL